MIVALAWLMESSCHLCYSRALSVHLRGLPLGAAAFTS
jgi:hypothetical protein